MSDIDAATYRRVLGHFPTGVTVITAMSGEEPVGLAIGSFFSVSLDPPTVGFCADHKSSSWPKIRDAGRFCVNVLSAEQEEACRLFAMKGEDRFSKAGWSPTAGTGSPLLRDVLAWIDCELDEVFPSGDHDIAVGRVVGLDASDGEGGPLLFYRGGYGRFAV